LLGSMMGRVSPELASHQALPMKWCLRMENL
jgi:hypothetical protein